MEEHSLRKIRSQGDRSSNLAEDFSFQSQILFAQMVDGNLQLSDVLHQTSRNLTDQKAVGNLSTEQKGT